MRKNSKKGDRTVTGSNYGTFLHSMCKRSRGRDN